MTNTETNTAPDLVLVAGRDLTCDTKRRLITGLAVPYGQTIVHGATPVRFVAGSVRWTKPRHVKLLVDHDSAQPVGYAVDLADTDDGLVATFHVPPGTAGDNALADAANGLRDGLSVGVHLDAAPADDGTVSGQLREVSLCAVPAFDTARVQTVAAAAHPIVPQPIITPAERNTAVTDTVDTTPAGPPADLEARGAVLQLTERLAELETRTAAQPPAPHPLASFGSLGQYAAAVFAGDAPGDLLRFAIVDQVTGDNPGVLPPSWSRDVRGIVDLGRPAVSAFGVESAGSSGMDYAWPYFDGDLSVLVGEQTTEKTDVTSVKVSLKKGTAALKTYAGDSDISYQLIQRSDPAYLTTYLRIMAAAYAVATDHAFGAALVTAATELDGYDLAADTTGAKLSGALFEASVAVEAATGQPAEFALVASDVFIKVGGMSNIINPAYGPWNASGVGSARTLRVQVNGLDVIHDQSLADGTILVSNGSAASWIEDGPRVADAETPMKLGRDVAIYGFATSAVYVPAGVIKLVKTATPASP